MTKLSRKTYEIKDFGLYVNNLWAAFTLLDTKEDIRLLFKDLFTHTEYKMFAKRLEVARRLLNQESYENIQKELKVTSQTISKINNILAERGEGLRTAHAKLERLYNEQIERQRKYYKRLENPLQGKIYRKTLLGSALKIGAKVLDKKISNKLKERSARKILSN